MHIGSSTSLSTFSFTPIDTSNACTAVSLAESSNTISVDSPLKFDSWDEDMSTEDIPGKNLFDGGKSGLSVGVREV